MDTKIFLGILLILVVGVNVNLTKAENKIIPIPIYSNYDYVVATNNIITQIRNEERLDYSDINEIIYIVSKEENISFELLKKEMILKNRIDFRGDRDSKRTLTI